MTKEELFEAFETHRDEYFKFDRIDNPSHKRRDVCAFVMLDQLFPAKGDILGAAEHDEVCLSIDLDELAEVATTDLIIFLQRCGVCISKSNESLYMIV